MRVLHISTRDIAGGAARAAYRLHRGLQRIGVESRMLVAYRSSGDDTVDTPALSRRIDVRLWRRLRREIIAREQRAVARSRLPGSEFYSAARSVYRETWPDIVGYGDVINLHWVADLLDWPSFFAAVPPGQPLVWTLHDIAPFTGGCHYAGTCARFVGRCGACPQLQSSRESDISRRTFDLKDRAYARLDPASTAIVAPSRWVAGESGRSALFSRFRTAHIPYGLDLDVFRPRNRSARAAFGFSDRDRVILFVSDRLGNRRKGMDLLLAALDGMERRDDLVLVSVGSGAAPSIDGIRRLQLGGIESDELLSVVYSIADVFVIPSREEQFGQTASEATACGCPVVAFAVGGTPDIVETGQTGFLVRPFDVRELRDCIDAAIRRRSELGQSGRLRAERLFGLEAQACAYERLYGELLGGGHASHRAATRAPIPTAAMTDQPYHRKDPNDALCRAR